MENRVGGKIAGQKTPARDKKKTLRTLVIGATGQLGSEIVRLLKEADQPVRAFVRHTSDVRFLKKLNVDMRIGDIKDLASLHRALVGIDVVISTSNAIIPRRGDKFTSNDLGGHANILNACKKASIKQFIFSSVPYHHYDPSVQTLVTKRTIEKMIVMSGVPYTIFRFPPFMDTYLASMGSRLLLQGTQNATMNRSFWFTRFYMRLVGSAIDKYGVALLPGEGNNKHSFISVQDAAQFMVKSIGRAENLWTNVHAGGPQLLSWNDLVDCYSRVLGRPVRAVHTPRWVFRVLQRLFRPIDPAASNLFGVNWGLCKFETNYPSGELAEAWGIKLTSAEEFLREKNELQDKIK